MHTIRPARRRWLVAALLVGVSRAAAADEAGAQEVWLDLSAPLPAGARDAAQARQRRQRVAAQQAAVAQRLRELGVVDRARVMHTRNAILVRITPQQALSIRGIPGVVRLRPARSLHPPKPMP